MKIVKKNVYYCGFCKKKGLSAGHMYKHEKHCTANLDRQCDFCDRLTKDVINDFWNSPGHTLEKIEGDFSLVGKIQQIKIGGSWKDSKGENHDSRISLKEIETLKGYFDCPICLLTFLRINKLNAFDWNWKKEALEELQDKYNDGEDNIYPIEDRNIYPENNLDTNGEIIVPF
jgi:hypothetical protein